MRPIHSQDGSALVSAVVLITVMIGLGLGLLLFTDNQQKASAREQWSEQAFEMAEAALNAQVGQLARAWPEKSTMAANAKGMCTEGESNIENYCPATVPFSTGYGKLSHITCPAGTTTEAWGSPITNQWTTYVKDDAGSETAGTYFNSALEKEQAGWDANGDNKLWVRAVGVVNCHLVTLVTLVSRQVVSVPFPKNVLGGNWFAITNKGGHGGKPVVNAEGEPPAPEAGEVGMRCEGISGTCEQFENGEKGHGTEQIQGYHKGAALPSPVLNEEQLAEVRSLALAKGTLHSPELKNCPTTPEELAGSPAYIEGCGNLTLTGNGSVNSPASPGFLVIADGTLTLTGTTNWYGVIYAHNASNSSEAIVKLKGATTVYGAIEVDGKGGIELGSNSVNLVYEPKAIVELKGSAGATPTRNTFRVLPFNQ